MSRTAENVLVCEHDGRRTTIEPLNLGQVTQDLKSESLAGLWGRGAIGGNRW